MFMVADQLPDCKRFFRSSSLSRSARVLVTRLVVTFVFHAGRMSCMQAAGAVRCEPRHRAQITRFLARPLGQSADFNALLRQSLLAMESRAGRWIYIIDATLIAQAGKKTQNTFSTGNRQRRPRKGRRYGKNKHVRKNCHSFTIGLLITPSGIRIPFCKPYRTHEYCKQTGWKHRTTAEAAADLIRELPLPEGAKVIVLGDTAYDSEAVRDACRDRGYRWIFPCNPERVLAGPKGERPKVRSLLKDWSKWSRQTIRLAPGQGRIRRLPASVAASDRAESETSDVLRPPGKTTGTLGRRGPARLFDNQGKPQNCHGRRRENPDDERPAAFLARRDRVVLVALADRAIFQGTQVDPGLPPVPVSEIRAGGRLGGVGAHGIHVPGVVPGATDVASRFERRGEALVAAPADIRSMPSDTADQPAIRVGVPGRPVDDPAASPN